MTKTNLTGDFEEKSIINDERVSWTRWTEDSPSELKVSGDASLKSFAEETKDFVLSRLRASSFQLILKERNFDIDELCIYLIPIPVNKEFKLAEYLHSVIIENVKLDNYKNTLFVFVISEKSVLIEVWADDSFSTIAIYQETKKPGYFFYEQWAQNAEKKTLCLNVMEYFDIQKSWLRSELNCICNSILNDDDALVLSL